MKTIFPSKRKTLLQATVIRQMEKRISFSDYLLEHGYEMVTPRIFVRPGSTEIIRLSRKNQKVRYINLASPSDKGTVIDFMISRTGEFTGTTTERTASQLASLFSTARNYLEKKESLISVALLRSLRTEMSTW